MVLVNKNILQELDKQAEILAQLKTDNANNKDIERQNQLVNLIAMQIKDNRRENKKCTAREKLLSNDYLDLFVSKGY